MSENHITETGLVYGHYKGVSISRFVRDLILFGQGRAVEVCKQHNVDDVLFKEIIELPFFKKEMREVRALTEASPNSMIQLKARALLEDSLERLMHIINDKDSLDRDKINAMVFLAKISGVLENGKQSIDDGRPQASGLVLNVQVGPTGIIPPLPASRAPLRDVSKWRNAEVVDGQSS